MTLAVIDRNISKYRDRLTEDQLPIFNDILDNTRQRSVAYLAVEFSLLYTYVWDKHPTIAQEMIDFLYTFPVPDEDDE